MNTVNIGLLGMGTVGGGTIRLLNRSAAEIARRSGRTLVVKLAAVRDLQKAKARADAPPELMLTTDPYQVVCDPQIDVVIEVMGGLDPAFDLVMTAIAHGKHVVTANKALIAKHGNEIFAAAEKRGVSVAFEAAVAGGIPIIKTIREGLAGNRIQWLMGIINGTTNYILTAMQSRQIEFADALAEAQRLGYAEADPSFDIDGIDAAHKLTILASIAFGIPLQFDKVHTDGIAAVAKDDITYAEELGYRIKYLAIARCHAHGSELRVHPTLIPRQHLLANVSGVMNAVLVHGDAVGDVLLYGAGAGAEPTASSVVADVVDVIRVLTAEPGHRVPYLGFQTQALTDLPILPMGQVESAYYLRMQVDDHPGVLADITRILASLQISIEAILQKPPQGQHETVTVILLTHQVCERQMDMALAQIMELEAVRGQITRLRLQNFQA